MLSSYDRPPAYSKLYNNYKANVRCVQQKDFGKIFKTPAVRYSSGLAMSQKFIGVMATSVVLQLMEIGSYLCGAETVPIHIRP